MAQKKSVNESTQEVRLTISKSDFKTQLQERLTIGEELLAMEVDHASNEKFQNMFRQWSDYNFELLKQSFNVETNSYRNAYNQAGYTFMGAIGEVPGNPMQSTKNTIRYKIESLQSLLNRADLIKSSYVEVVDTSSKPINSNEVFIVHGHDDLAKISVARFIERLGLRSIILHEQSNSGRTIIEKIEEYTNVGFAIVLYTQCDIGGKNTQSLQPRARQNVVFEHGYLMGKIGRGNVCALTKGSVETPSDISGVVYVPMDDSEAWHYKIAKELKASGYSIDMNRV